MAHYKDEYPLSYVRLDDDLPQKRKSRPLSSAEQQAVLESTIFWGSSWTLEFISCLMSVIFLAAIIVVLYMYDGKPMPDWPYGITLNALVSVLSTVMKAAMVFIITEALSQLKWSWFSKGNKLSDLALLDAASRGPAGAFIALFRFVPRHLVTFGCLVLVIAAATDPFVQQVMGIKERSVQAPGKSSIQICDSNEYNDWDEGAGPGMNKVPLSTLGAIYSGIFQEQTPNKKNTLMDCATGNCTFTPYQTLGFCSRCANITSSLKKKKQAGMVSYMSAYNYTLPNGFYFHTASNMNYLMNATSNKPLIELDTKDLAVILNFTAISSDGYGMTPVSATECALYYCVDTYKAAVTGGKFTETITSNVATSNASSTGLALKNIAITPETCYFNGSRLNTTSSPNCTYTVNWLSLLSMSNSLSPLLKGTGSRFVSNRPSWSSDTAEALYGYYGNYTEINSVFESLASSLSIHARSKVCHAAKNGTAWTTQSYVQVRWLWMILPCALVVLSMGFLVVVVFHTRKQFIWKSSPLALLFSDLRVDGEGNFKRDPTLKGMEDTSRKMDVWLESSADGPRLKAVASRS
ncbi:unnamed protein product [Penicillium salamii]|uniref:Uncharacterized protein n=1 Tax=Penicillium salamii TaxID=1612424 RepID=A0A9W4J1Z3_9EURO|nr:unnamed protein product [Penicillium salamii]CAG8304719.1 unnamed protein product [Penicillium salamii]CAG8373926.1 unnamed protein product [Penicillium salamii]CAG8390139.1 unnamed protein product [Penicillium salamii]CAG8408637.1 unnamed protein product [Penicillium salamii]